MFFPFCIILRIIRCKKKRLCISQSHNLIYELGIPREAVWLRGFCEIVLLPNSDSTIFLTSASSSVLIREVGVKTASTSL